MSDLAMVFDCGATNVRAVAVDAAGEILAAASLPNAPVAQDGEGLIWDMDEIWGKLSACSSEVCAQISPGDLRAVTVTTFGADGAPVNAAGQQTYPVISWADNTRTADLARRMGEDPGGWPLFERTGYQIITFDTLLRLLWLRENAPSALAEADSFLMTPGLLSLRLSGERSIDPTIAGTSMAVDMAHRDWAPELLALAGLDPSFFPRWVEPGGVIGAVLSAAAADTGLPAGLPVVAAGHDTQFAPFGAGASEGEAILSSGTWEIAMLRSPEYRATREGYEQGLIIEADALPGFWNPQLLMMGSGVLEWVRGNFFPGATGEEGYETMIAAAREVPPGSDGVALLPSFVADSGPTRKYNVSGALVGLGLQSGSAHIYRAALEGLCYQLRWALEILDECAGFEAQAIRVVGGGSRNKLWNQLRADITGLPVTVIAQKEATVLGASRFALVGAGVFGDVAAAQAALELDETIYAPGHGHDVYEGLYQSFRELPVKLAGWG